MIARVFPRITKATPNDALAYYGPPPMFLPEITEVHISVAFTYDMNHAEWLAGQWHHIAPVKMGGPAFNQPGGAFVPGRYLKPGYVITSRGCPNKCWFCSVWKRENGVNELEINNGWNVLDDNLLACSEQHIRSVFKMLKSQSKKVEFTGGLEAAILKEWHVDLLADLKPAQMFFAYDTPDDYEHLVNVSKMLKRAGFSRNQMRCYVLIGHPKDTISMAEKRLYQCLKLDYFPMAMLWRNKKGEVDVDWSKFQREWARPAIISQKYKLAKKINKEAVERRLTKQGVSTVE